MNTETIALIRTAFEDAATAADDANPLVPSEASFARWRAAEDALAGDPNLPSFVDGEHVEDLTNGHALLVDVLGEYDELQLAREYRFRILWRTSKWKSGGMVVAGSCGPVPDREREIYSVEPQYQVTLNLAWWLSLDEDGRKRLLHHELMHAALGTKGHPVEEWPGTVKRFGLSGWAQARLVVEALCREGIREELDALLHDDDPEIPEWVPSSGSGSAGGVKS